MKTITAAVVVIVISAYSAYCQHGTAPNGYYPPGYQFDTFTGTSISSDTATDTVTLEFKKDAKAETLSIILEGGCAVPSKTGEPMHAKDIPQGTVLTAYYMPKTEKVAGEKRTVYLAIGISFREWQGKPVAEKDRKLYSCGASAYRVFKARPA